MGLKWLKYLREKVGDDDEIVEIKVKVEYRDGRKRKYIFAGNNPPVVEDDIDEEDENENEGFVR
ncbi:hypothetical protein [Brevibacillus brevis]|uniref:Uncharacterized protein n=1 Tax=Brevibacillus brevis TaxID=1393 RepID=A0ABY9SXU9_BREBE|nr:hypothetical protein [Brevibacillus brevis]WNC12661.1 hypothetical protein RGB73_18215 [Brevibacillus brevis]